MRINAPTATPPRTAAAAQARAARIAIIGSGASGLVAARVLTRNSNGKHHKPHVVVLEKNADVGGVWNYQHNKNELDTDAAHPMYAGLRTNLPKEIMAYREFPWPSRSITSTAAETSFVTHYQVKEYLKQYRDHFQLDHLIQTNCNVTQLKCLPNTRSCFSPTASLHDADDAPEPDCWPQIQLDWIDSSPTSKAPQQQSAIFDAVLVCNGHYHRPAYPNLPGLQQLLLQQQQQPSSRPGKILHSIDYDTPDEFVDQIVLCVGGRASGSDLAREISRVARHVYLSDTTCDQNWQSQDQVTRVPATTVVAGEEDGRISVVLNDHQKITNIDTIIFCSGYDYDFPFVNAQSNLPLTTTGRRVQPLYEQLWHANTPNVAFVGLPHSVVPFPLFELQVEAVWHSWTESTPRRQRVLPSLTERLAAAERDAQSGGEGRGRVPEDTHFLGPRQWDYCRRMAQYAGLYSHHDAESSTTASSGNNNSSSIEDHIATQEAIYNDVSDMRRNEFPAGPDKYRSLCYKRLDDRHSFERWMLLDNDNVDEASKIVDLAVTSETQS